MGTMIINLQDKTYVRAFGLLSPEEQECLRKVGRDNCLFYSSFDRWDTVPKGNTFSKQDTYAIKPDYQPEPETMDLEIKKGNEDGVGGGKCWLGIWTNEPEYKDMNFPFFFVHLHCLPSMENFEGFYLKDGDNVVVEIEWVARYYRNVVARFGV